MKLVIKNLLFVFVSAFWLTGCLSGGVSFEINFESNGGTPVESIETRGNETLKIPSNPTREGYIFGGWYWDNGIWERPFTANSILETQLSSDMTVYARWHPTTNVVLFDVEESYLISGELEQVVNYNEGAIAPIVEKEGYSLTGWSEQFNAVKEDLIIFPEWSINSYTIMFDSDGGSEVSSITQDFGTEVVEPVSPIKEGHTFVEWQLEGVNYEFTTMPSLNITLRALWETNEYNVIFDSLGGTSVLGQLVNLGDLIEEPVTPIKEGHTFIGWNLYGTLVDFSILKMPNENITLTAQWSINEYTITFDSNGGSEVLPITGEFGAEVVKPSEPTREAHTFIEWQIDGSKYDFTTIPSSNITVIALWQPIYCGAFASNLTITQSYSGQIVNYDSSNWGCTGSSCNASISGITSTSTPGVRTVIVTATGQSCVTDSDSAIFTVEGPVSASNECWLNANEFSCSLSSGCEWNSMFGVCQDADSSPTCGAFANNFSVRQSSVGQLVSYASSSWGCTAPGCSASISGTTSTSNPGSYSVIVSATGSTCISDSQSAIFTVNPPLATNCQLSALDQTRVWNGGPQSYTAASSSNCTISTSCSRTAVGSTLCNVSAFDPSPENPKNTTYATATLTVIKASCSIIAPDWSTPYTGSNTVYSGIIWTDCPGGSGELILLNANRTNAGSQVVTVSFEGNSNYNSTSDTATFTVTRIDPTCIISDSTQTFDGSRKTIIGTTNGGSRSYLYSGETILGEDYGPTPDGPIHPGTYTVTMSVAASQNYNEASCSATLNIVDSSTTSTTIPGTTPNHQLNIVLDTYYQKKFLII